MHTSVKTFYLFRREKKSWECYLRLQINSTYGVCVDKKAVGVGTQVLSFLYGKLCTYLLIQRYYTWVIGITYCSFQSFPVRTPRLVTDSDQTYCNSINSTSRDMQRNNIATSADKCKHVSIMVFK